MTMIGDNSRKRSVNSLTAAEKTKLRNIILELDASMTRVAAERDLMKASIEKAYDELRLDKKLVRRMGKTHFKATFKEEKESNSDFEDFYDLVMNGPIEK